MEPPVEPPIEMTSEEAWERLTVGETIGPVPLAFPWEEQEIRLQALGNAHPWYTQTSPCGGPLFFPPLLLTLYFQLQRRRYIIHRHIHAKAELESIRPFSPDTPLLGKWQVVDKYQRRGGRYLVTETAFYCAAGPDQAGEGAKPAAGSDGHGLELLARVRNVFLMNARALYGSQGEG